MVTLDVEDRKGREGLDDSVGDYGWLEGCSRDVGERFGLSFVEEDFVRVENWLEGGLVLGLRGDGGVLCWKWVEDEDLADASGCPQARRHITHLDFERVRIGHDSWRKCSDLLAGVQAGDMRGVEDARRQEH